MIETVVCPVCRGDNEGLCIRCEGRGRVELTEGDARDVLRAVRAHPLLVATEGDDDISGADAVDALCEIRAALDAAGYVPQRRPPPLEEPAHATVESARAYRGYIHALQEVDDDEAAYSGIMRLRTWALAAVLADAPAARAVADVAYHV